MDFISVKKNNRKSDPNEKTNGTILAYDGFIHSIFNATKLQNIPTTKKRF